jgi:hypothetical protein
MKVAESARWDLASTLNIFGLETRRKLSQKINDGVNLHFIGCLQVTSEG